MGDAHKGTKVFVGNLPPEAEARDLRDFFRDFGQINDAWVARKPPGFGFVWFDDERDARDACRDLDGRDILHNRVRVEISSNARRGGGGGGGGGGGYGRSPPRRYGRSPSPRRGRSPSPKRYGRSPSPRRGRSPPPRDRRERSRSPGGGRSPAPRDRSRDRD